MAKARSIVKHRRAVQNICKITRTMQLISTAQFQAALKRAAQARPYTDRLRGMVEQLARWQGDIEHPLLRVNSETNREWLIVITSNRGLCGGYNGGLLRGALAHLDQQEAAGKTVDLLVSGRKGIRYFGFLGWPIARRETQIEHKPQFSRVEPIAAELIDAYQRREIDAVYVTYSRFISAGAQHVTTIQLLPAEPPAPSEDDAQTEPEVRYDFTPPASELLAELLPETVKLRLFQCFIDAAVSEQVARMVAMKAATESAGDMMRVLTRQYNRARQTQITLELLDIVGGVEALA